MKICIPTESDEGLAAVVAGHLGRAPFLTLVDTETAEVAILPNTPHAGRFCSPEPLAGTGVEAVVCCHAGRGAVARLLAAGLHVLVTDAPRVGDAVSAARRGGLRRLDPSDACHGEHEAPEGDACCGGGKAH